MAPVFHEYVPEPLAVSVLEAPEHIVVGAADTVIVGVGLTVTVTVCWAAAQPPLLPFTV